MYRENGEQLVMPWGPLRRQAAQQLLQVLVHRGREVFAQGIYSLFQIKLQG